MSGELSVAEDERFATAKVADGLLLDSRLALYHETQRWLAVSDLHLGCNPNDTARPEMVKLWGMPDIETRLIRLLDHYQPRKLIIAGDVMHFSGSVSAAAHLLGRLSKRVEVVCVAGNHDHPELTKEMKFANSHVEDGYVFHHGHRLQEMLIEMNEAKGPLIHITGHSHPTTMVEGAGVATRRLPVFAQVPYPSGALGEQRWIIPAFAPWASGAWPMHKVDGTRLFALQPGAIMEVT